MSQTSSPEDQYIGKVLNNKIRIDALLGRGGMGAVYRATDIVLDRAVAVKLLRQELIGQDNLDSRFLREARAAARIEHPHAITVHDFGTLSDGNAFIVMEFIQGCSLRDLVRREGPLQAKRAVEIMRQACSAVAAAHHVGVIHRDLKPENIMLKNVAAGPANVKVVDFGLAKLKETLSQSISNLTSNGAIIGTPFYMSPEQCAGNDIDERTDIYSLGIIFYEVLTGKPPFQGMPAAVIGMHLYKKVTPLNEIVPTISPVLEEIVHQMLAKEKDARQQSLEQVLRQLDDNRVIADPASLYTPGQSTDISYERQKAETLKQPAENVIAATAIVEEKQPTKTLESSSSTKEQSANTILYNSVDFQTRASEPLPVVKAAPVGVSTPHTVVRATGLPAQARTVAIASRKQGYKKFILIGAAGILIGGASVFLFQPAQPSQPTRPPVTTAPAVSRPNRPAEPPVTEKPAKENKEQTQPEENPNSTAPDTDPDSKQEKQKAKTGKKDESENKGGIFKRFGRGVVGIFKGKKK